MPADRTRRSTRRNRLSDDDTAELSALDVSFTTGASPGSVSPTTSDPPTPTDASCDPGSREASEIPAAVRGGSSRRKPSGHIPRPPNAFILFRSAFIRNQHVSSEVETSHSTLSKIIGLTWQNLPQEERQMWHARAKIAQAEHKLQFPQYAFRPVHKKARGAVTEKRRIREAGPRDQKRCETIAQLLVNGVQGEELKEAIQEFDRTHVPEIITRFEAPITAQTFCHSQNKSKQVPHVPTSRRTSRSTPPPAQPLAKPEERSPSPSFLCKPQQESDIPSITISDRDTNPSFDYSTFAFNSVPCYPSSSRSTSASSTSFGTPAPDACSLDIPFDQPALRALSVNDSFGSLAEWGRSHSPMSTSTGSMPTTPALVGIHFPEIFNSYPAQTPSHGHQAQGQLGYDTQGSHLSPSHTHDYQPFTNHGDGLTNYTPSPSGNFVPPYQFGCPTKALHAPMGHSDADYSTFVQPISYSLPMCR